MFLLLDLETLERVIARELDRQREVEVIFQDNNLESRQPAVEPQQIRIKRIVSFSTKFHSEFWDENSLFHP